MVATTTGLMFMNIDDKDANTNVRKFGSVAVLIMWLKLFYFLRLFT
jgi:hypothetical protein